MSAVLTVSQFAAVVSGLGPKMARALSLTLKSVTRTAHRDAIRNAPRSPTAAQQRSERKARWVAKHGNAKGFAKAQKAGKLRRKPNSHSRAAPGGLERSIRWQVKGSGLFQDGEIFVAANAEAGKYAKRIHDDKGKSWHKRGAGTRAKGTQADDKYIERAIEKARKTFEQELYNTFGRL